MRCKPITKVVIVNDSGEILSLRRSRDDTDRAGGWDFPGGGVLAGEDLVAAVKREATEEAGIAVKSPQLVWSMTEEHPAGFYMVWLIYIAHIKGRPPVVLSNEHDRYQWFAPEDFLAINPYKKHHALFAYLKAHQLFAAQGGQLGTVTARAFVRNTKGELLILRRSQTDTFFAGTWDLPGGRMKPGEDPLQTVIRETQEEAGIHLQAPQLVFAVSSPKRIGPWLFYIENTGNDVAPLLGNEHDRYKWIPFADLPHYTDYEILRAAHAWISRHDLV